MWEQEGEKKVLCMSEVLLSDVMCEYRMVCRALVEGGSSPFDGFPAFDWLSFLLWESLSVGLHRRVFRAHLGKLPSLSGLVSPPGVQSTPWKAPIDVDVQSTPW